MAPETTRRRSSTIGAPRTHVFAASITRPTAATARRFARGLREASGELVFFSDADLQFELSEIAALLAHADDVDIVAGYRAPRRDPWPRRAIAIAWGALVGLVFDLSIRDIDCAFKVFRREVIDAIPIESVGAFINTEILVPRPARVVSRFDRFR